MLDQTLLSYLQRFSTPQTDVLHALTRETHLKVNLPQMITEPYAGRFLTMITHMIQPQRILEIGTFTGYTAICFAMGLPENGVLHTIEINEEQEDRIRKFLALAKVDRQVQLHIGDARKIIPTLDEVFDLVFIDATKLQYDEYYELVFSKIRKGGFILSDNVLWYGKVLNEHGDKKTAAIHAYNEKIHADPRVENILLPIGDGIMIARKIL
jgi:caffeoyl-CoA O-methyltransferase